MAGIMNENPLEYGVRIAYRPKSWSIPIEVAKNIGMSNNNMLLLICYLEVYRARRSK